MSEVQAEATGPMLFRNRSIAEETATFENMLESANTVPLREQVRDSVEFVRSVWEEIERSLREDA